MTPALMKANANANTLGEKAQHGGDKDLDAQRAWLRAEEAFFAVLGVLEPLVDPNAIENPIVIAGVARELHSGRLGILRLAVSCQMKA